MHKKFYASGFLYHSPSDKILLQRQNSTDLNSPWSLLGSISLGLETSSENFQRNAHNILHVDLQAKSTYPIYDYDNSGKNYVSYAQVKNLVAFLPVGETVFAWFSAKEILKLTLSAQTKQDIIVGQRVIEASDRQKAGERIIE